MNPFKRIRIRGYRRLFDVDVEMRSLTVLIGANGIGKTSFLEAWSLLAASSSGQLRRKLSELAGLNEVITKDRARQLTFDLEMSVPDHDSLKYHLRISPQGQSYSIEEETLSSWPRKGGKEPFKSVDSKGVDIRYFDTGARKLVRPNWQHDPLETSLAQVPRMFKAPEDLRMRLASSTFYGALDVARDAPVRLPQTIKPADLPGAQGEDLVSCLFSLRETDRSRFEVLEDTLAGAFSDFERLEFPPVAAGALALTWRDKNYRSPMYMHQLSEGTLRFLWLATLLQSRDSTTVTLIDEPDVSLHPELQVFLVDLMREASKRTHLVVATHSDRLVRALKPEEVLVADMNDGVATLTWGDDMDLAHWLKDYSLDELWQMGRLGGRS